MNLCFILTVLKQINCSCNNINDPYAKLCIPDAVKDINVKAFNLMSRTNETKYIEWHEIYTCKFTLDKSV